MPNSLLVSNTALESREPVKTNLSETTKRQFGEWAYVLAITFVYLAAEVHNAHLRTFWFDELSTLVVTVRPTLRQMFGAMPTDGNPPLYFLLARSSLHLPVNTELALRLPSILAFLGTGIATYLFVRRIAPFCAALLSMCFFLGSQFAEDYATEARAYSLLLFFTAASLCLWQEARRGHHRKFALAGIAACTSCAILSHQYGILYALLPICVGEGIALLHRRKDVAVIASAALGSLTVLLTYPPMLRGQRTLLAEIRNCPGFSDRPDAADIGMVYGAMWPIFIPTLAMFVAVAWFLAYAMLPRRKQTADPEVRRPLPEELAAANLLVLFVPLTLLVTTYGTRYFAPRYAIGSALGIAIVMGLLAAQAVARWPKTREVISLITLYCIVVGALHVWVSRPAYNRPLDYSDVIVRAPSQSEPIVVASALEFPPYWWYANAATRARIHYLSDLPYARQTGNLLAELCLNVERHHTPMQMDDCHAFLEAHRHFLIYSVGQTRLEWLLPRLRSEGWTLQLIGRTKDAKLYRASLSK